MSREVPNGIEDGPVKEKKTNASAKIDQLTAELEKGKQSQKLQDLQKEDVQDDNSDDDEGDSDKGGFCGSMNLQTQVVLGVASTSLVINIVAMAVEAATIMYIAGILAVLMAPVVFVLQLKLKDTDSMRKVQNALRSHVNRLQDENNKLTAETNVLEEEVTKLKDLEKDLEEITSAQGASADEFRQLVKENQELIEKQSAAVRHSTAQVLTSVVIGSDLNADGTISETELKRLEIRLKAFPGVSVDTTAMRGSLAASGGSIGRLLEMAHKLSKQQSTSGNVGSNRVPTAFSIVTAECEKEGSDDDNEGIELSVSA